MKIPNPWFGPLPWNRLWKSSLAAGKRSRRFSPAVPCHAAEGTSDNLYTYLADTTLAGDICLGSHILSACRDSYALDKTTKLTIVLRYVLLLPRYHRPLTNNPSRPEVM